MRNIAVIPARSGSKGLQDKNIRELAGKPLLVYSVEAALTSGIYDTVHVSTDSEEYANIARKAGAEVLFLRSKELASDTATTWDAMRFVLNKYKEMNKVYDTLTVLQPTSPLRASCDILNAHEFFKAKSASFVSSVCEMEHSPLWCNTLPEDLSMADFENKTVAYLPRQALPTYYRENGAIYIVDVRKLLSSEELYTEGAYAYIMEQNKSIDIDSEVDFRIAELLMKSSV